MQFQKYINLHERFLISDFSYKKNVWLAFSHITKNDFLKNKFSSLNFSMMIIFKIWIFELPDLDQGIHKHAIQKK